MIINEEIELDRKEQIWTNYERRNTLDQKPHNTEALRLLVEVLWVLENVAASADEASALPSHGRAGIQHSALPRLFLA